MATFKIQRYRTKTILIFGLSHFVITVLAIVNKYNIIEVFQRAKQSDGNMYQVVVDLLNYELFLIRFGMFCFILILLLFIQWVGCAYNNQRTKVFMQKYSPRQAYWSWFIPVVNLIKPFQILLEIYCNAIQLISFNRDSKVKNITLTFFCCLWAFVLTIIITNPFIIPSYIAVAENETMNYFYNKIVINIASIIINLLIMKVVWDYSRIEPLLAKINTRAEVIVDDSFYKQLSMDQA